MAIENGVLKPTGAIQLRGGTADALTSENPVLSKREIMIETDTGKLKVGTDGLTAWNSLAYVGGWLSEEFASIENTINRAALHNLIKADNIITLDSALTAIANETFKDIYPGTIIVKELRLMNDISYKVLDINYFKDMNKLQTPHIVVKRESTVITNQELVSTANFSTGGYYGFTEFREWLSDYTDTIVAELGQEHVLEHNEYLCDGISNGEPSSYNWYASKCELMTGSQFLGNRFYGTRYLGGYPQFSYYKLSRNSGSTSSGILRDVASTNELYTITDGQLSTFTVAVGEYYVLEPYFCIC